MLGAGVSPQFVNNHPEGSLIGNFVKNTLTFGGSANASLQQTPLFQFLPVTGSNLVQAIMVPISDKVLYTFFDQGYPADLVARTMVSSVRYESGITTNMSTNLYHHHHHQLQLECDGKGHLLIHR